MFCPKCGNQSPDQSKFCPACGHAIQDNQVIPPPIQDNQAIPPLNQPQAKPNVPNHLIWAILATLFCCMPTGIVAIIYSSSVSSKLAIGDVDGALRASKNAKTWCIVSLAAWILIFFLGMISAVALPAFSDYEMKSREAEAVNLLGDIRTAQLAFKEINGFCAPDLQTLQWTVLGGGVTGSPPASYHYSTSNDCSAMAEAKKPDSVRHSIISINADGEILFR